MNDSIQNTDLPKAEVAVFAGGCFWCMEAVFELIPGIVSLEPGYTGGNIKDPTYREVCNGQTKHAEAIRIIFAPDQITYEKLLEIFFSAHNPTTLDSQGGDFGSQYRSEIFYTSEKQKRIAEKYIEEIESSFSDPIVTKLEELSEFYVAEEYHHGYFKKNPEQVYCKIFIKSKVDSMKKKLKY
jgi:peptide-methionine (S)-S-oxide reductase